MRRTKSHAQKPFHDTVEDAIARLRGLEFRQLQARWQSVTGREAPPHLPRHLLFAMIAYRIQAEAYGDLDADTLRLLNKVRSVQSGAEVTPLTDVFDERRRELLPGSVLTREWNRQHHRVMVVADGFAWEGRTYDSLSKIAHAITGTKWNGPRFFGLRDNKPAMAKP